jgi:hypothetical protein
VYAGSIPTLASSTPSGHVHKGLIPLENPAPARVSNRIRTAADIDGWKGVGVRQRGNRPFAGEVTPPRRYWATGLSAGQATGASVTSSRVARSCCRSVNGPLVAWVLRHRATSAFYSVLAVSFALVVSSAIAVASFEQDAAGANIQTAEDALWWALSTITTVGYGDRFPVTTEGRGVATMLMLASLGLVGTLSGVIAAWFLGPAQEKHAASVEAESQLTAKHVRELDAALRELKTTLDELRTGKSLPA